MPCNSLAVARTRLQNKVRADIAAKLIETSLQCTVTLDMESNSLRAYVDGNVIQYDGNYGLLTVTGRSRQNAERVQGNLETLLKLAPTVLAYQALQKLGKVTAVKTDAKGNVAFRLEMQ